MSLRSNYKEVLVFFNRLRLMVGRRGRFYMDFRTIEVLSPAATLMLAAELDRWRRVGGFRPTIIDLEQWRPEVRRLLEEMGLFDLLDVKNPPPSPALTKDSARFVRFATGKGALGADAVAMRKAIEAVAGELPDRRDIYDGIVESMTNVVHHAYPTRASYWVPVFQGTWWMAGSFDPLKRQLRILFYDQGVGLPATIPRKNNWEQVRALLKSNDDGDMIAAAFEWRRSRTRLKHRGRGLARISRVIDSVSDGSVRILSGRGEYTYDRKDGGRANNNPIPLGGTLIQWELILPGA